MTGWHQQTLLGILIYPESTELLFVGVEDLTCLAVVRFPCETSYPTSWLVRLAVVEVTYHDEVPTATPVAGYSVFGRLIATGVMMCRCRNNTARCETH